MKNKLIKLIFVLFSTLNLTNFANAAEEVKLSGEDLVTIQEDFEKMQEILLIDVRPEEQYNEGHITYAINIPVDELDNSYDRIEEMYGLDFPIVVYCNTDNKSTEAKDKFIEAGFTDVTVADGVKDHEYNLVTYENIMNDEFVEALESDDIVIIDYQFEKDFNKNAVPGAILGDPEKMDDVLEQLPEDKTIPIYNYCYVGVRSGLGAQIIKDAGYENVYNIIIGTASEDFPAEAK